LIEVSHYYWYLICWCPGILDDGLEPFCDTDGLQVLVWQTWHSKVLNYWADIFLVYCILGWPIKGSTFHSDYVNVHYYFSAVASKMQGQQQLIYDSAVKRRETPASRNYYSYRRAAGEIRLLGWLVSSLLL